MALTAYEHWTRYKSRTAHVLCIGFASLMLALLAVVTG